MNMSISVIVYPYDNKTQLTLFQKERKLYRGHGFST
jgi:hypothetical protein